MLRRQQVHFQPPLPAGCGRETVDPGTRGAKPRRPLHRHDLQRAFRPARDLRHSPAQRLPSPHANPRRRGNERSALPAARAPVLAGTRWAPWGWGVPKGSEAWLPAAHPCSHAQKTPLQPSAPEVLSSGPARSGGGGGRGAADVPSPASRGAGGAASKAERTGLGPRAGAERRWALVSLLLGPGAPGQGKEPPHPRLPCSVRGPAALSRARGQHPPWAVGSAGHWLGVAGP